MKRLIKIYGGLLLLLIILVFIFGRGRDAAERAVTEVATRELQTIEDQVAADAVKQYDIAKRNGNAIDAYAAASMVTAAYLQANDEANYKKWKEIENAEAARAGILVQ